MPSGAYFSRPRATVSSVSSALAEAAHREQEDHAAHRGRERAGTRLAFLVEQAAAPQHDGHEVRAEREHREVRDRAQVELLALEHAEDSENAALPARVTAHDPDHEQEEDQDQRRTASDRGVEQLGDGVAAHREHAPHDRNERRREREEPEEQRHRCHAHREPRLRRLADGERRSRRMGGAERPREAREHEERRHRGAAEARERRAATQLGEVLGRALRVVRLEDVRRDEHAGADADDDGEQDPEIAEQQTAERRPLRRASLDDLHRDGARLEQRHDERGCGGATEGEHEAEQRAKHPEVLLDLARERERERTRHARGFPLWGLPASGCDASYTLRRWATETWV